MNNYVKLPKDIIENERKLPEKAVRLYAMMLDRHSLSEKNKWADKNGTYIIFSQAEIQERLSVKKRRASSLLAALKEAHLISCRKQPGRPDRIYLTAKSVSNIAHQDSSVNNQTVKTEEFYDFYVSFFEDMAYQDADYGCSESVQEAVSGKNMQGNTKCVFDRKAVSAEKKLTRKKCVKRCTTGDAKKVHHSNNINIYTKSNISNQSKSDAITSTHEKCKAEFAKQIDYDALVYDEPQNHYLPLIVEAAADVLASERESIRCAGSNRWNQDVRQRLGYINFTHVKYILECMKGTSVPIRSPKAYLLTCLYNAPVTMEAYYDSQAKHALASGGSMSCPDVGASGVMTDEWDELFMREINE